MKKTITLKNGQTAILHFNPEEQSDTFAIYALNTKRHFVGKCLFSITSTHLETFCTISVIEVFDDLFIGQGLGYAMLKEMEKFAIEKKCTKISAWFVPMGRFPEYSGDFYQRNGFVVEKKEMGRPVLSKELSLQKELTKQ